MKRILLFSVLFLCAVPARASRIETNTLPAIGGQVFIEPGQSDADVEGWFRTLADNDMNLCRIRMFEKYMRTPDGGWDFSLFDRAFEMAEKYGIKVYATLFPYTEFEDVGGFKFPRSHEHQTQVAEYIERTVSHFSKYPALSAWVLINEPGSTVIPFGEELTDDMYARWKREHPSTGFNDTGWPVSDLSKERFLVDHNTWYLNWLAGQVRSYDPHTDLHVNPHQIFRLAGVYDFPAWRPFLNSLGGSAHASWHFGYFDRRQYAVAMSANAEMIRSGAGPLPWLMTELQGGNNLYSGADQMCPTPQEIIQWLWVCLVGEAKGGIFWSLNPRASGAEAGEWALLDFKGRPSDRMLAAARIGRFIGENPAMMSSIRTRRSGITILYNRESMWVESLQTQRSGADDARSRGASVRSALAWFETISQLGLQADLAEVRESGFAEDPATHVVILSHQIALDAETVAKLEKFVRRGGKLIVDGLSGFYDEDGHSPLVAGHFPLAELLGASPLEFKHVADKFPFPLGEHTLTANMWRGTIETSGARVLADYQGAATATVNSYGEGEAVWIPSPIGLGARLSGDHRALAAWLFEQLPAAVREESPRFALFERDIVMKPFSSEGKAYAVVINKSDIRRTVALANIRGAEVIFSSGTASVSDNILTLDPEETVVMTMN